MTKTNTNQTQESGRNINPVLGTGLSIQIMEATGRFEYVGEHGNLIEFWDKELEATRRILKNFTVKDTVQYIVNYFKLVYEHQGEEKAKRQIRQALGL